MYALWGSWHPTMSIWDIIYVFESNHQLFSMLLCKQIENWAHDQYFVNNHCDAADCKYYNWCHFCYYGNAWYFLYRCHFLDSKRHNWLIPTMQRWANYFVLVHETLFFLFYIFTRVLSFSCCSKAYPAFLRSLHYPILWSPTISCAYLNISHLVQIKVSFCLFIADSWSI